MTLDEIKEALQAGCKVFTEHEGYEIIKTKFNQYMITFVPTGWCIGLTWNDGITPNCDLSKCHRESEYVKGLREQKVIA